MTYRANRKRARVTRTKRTEVVAHLLAGDWPRPQFVSLHVDEPLLTPHELAQKLKVGVSWIYEQTRSRAGTRNAHPLPHRRMGKYLRFAWSEVVDWLEQLRAQQEHSQGSPRATAKKGVETR